MSLTDSQGIAAFDFSNLSGYTQIINESTYKLNNYLQLLLTNISGVVDLDIGLPLGNSDHSSISFLWGLKYLASHFL